MAPPRIAPVLDYVVVSWCADLFIVERAMQHKPTHSQEDRDAADAEYECVAQPVRILGRAQRIKDTKRENSFLRERPMRIVVISNRNESVSSKMKASTNERCDNGSVS